MTITQEKACELCNKTEWATLEKSFPPRLDELSTAIAKKQANRVRRFLDEERGQPQSETSEVRQMIFEEALRRLEARLPDKDDDAKAAKREKEKAQRERSKALREQQIAVKAKLQEKAPEADGKAGIPQSDRGDTGGATRAQKSQTQTQKQFGARRI